MRSLFRRLPQPTSSPKNCRFAQSKRLKSSGFSASSGEHPLLTSREVSQHLFKQEQLMTIYVVTLTITAYHVIMTASYGILALANDVFTKETRP